MNTPYHSKGMSKASAPIFIDVSKASQSERAEFFGRMAIESLAKARQRQSQKRLAKPKTIAQVKAIHA